MLATKPIPHASCSWAGSYNPWGGGSPCALVEGHAIVRFLRPHTQQSAQQSSSLPGSHAVHRKTSRHLLWYSLGTSKVQFRISIRQMKISATTHPRQNRPKDRDIRISDRTDKQF